MTTEVTNPKDQSEDGADIALKLGAVIDEILGSGGEPLLLLKIMESMRCDLSLLITRLEVRAAFKGLEAALLSRNKSQDDEAGTHTPGSEYLT